MLFFCCNLAVFVLCWQLQRNLGHFFDCLWQGSWLTDAGFTCRQCLSPLLGPLFGRLYEFTEEALHRIFGLPDFCTMMVYTSALFGLWIGITLLAALCLAGLMDRIMRRDVHFAAARVRADADAAAAYAVRVFSGAGRAGFVAGFAAATAAWAGAAAA
jgi:hypothetical protein